MRIHLKKDKKFTFILVLTLLLSFISIASADTEITVNFEYYGPWHDVNHDGIDNYLDVSSMVSHYRETCPPRQSRGKGEYRWDINGDGIVNYLDVSGLVSHYREVWLVP